MILTCLFAAAVAAPQYQRAQVASGDNYELEEIQKQWERFLE